MIGTTAAILGSAVIGAGASAISSSNAAKKAANSSQYATDQTTALNNKALDLQQQNTQPYRDAGALSTQALLEQLGLAQPKASTASSQAGSPDWNGYIAAHPDLAETISGPNSNQFTGATPQEKAADHYARYGQAAGWQLPTTAAPAKGDQPQVLPASTGPNGQPTVAVGTDPTRPGLTQTAPYQAPTTTQTAPYAAPSFVSTPGYQAPDAGKLDVSLNSYQVDPGYNWQQSEASRATLAGSAATGALHSGAAAKALQDRAQQIANTDYSNWRSYTTGQYNTDRSRADQNAQFGYNALLGQNSQQNSLNSNNAQFGYNALSDQNKFKDTAAIDAAQFGYNALTNQNNTNNQYGQQAFNTDRAFTADQSQQKTNNLFSLSGLGASAAGSANSAIGANAANNGNALFSNASAQGNAALASAGQVNNAINTGTNALAYYFGNKKVA